MANIYYVYLIFRANGEPCYVGKGQRDRIKYHFQPAVLSSHKNKHLAAIIKKASGELPVIKLRAGLSESKAHEIEVAFIKAIGRAPHGPLVNLTEGGEGISNPSKKTRLKMSKSRKKRVTKPETRLKISAYQKGRKKTPEHIEKVRLANLGKKRSKITRNRISKSKRDIKRKPHSEETKAKIRASWNKPGTKENRIAQKIGRKNTPETIEKMRQAAILRHSRNK